MSYIIKHKYFNNIDMIIFTSYLASFMALNFITLNFNEALVIIKITQYVSYSKIFSKTIFKT